MTTGQDTDELVERRMFPIMHGEDIPWAVIAPCEEQAQRNHSQSLKRLAERGGLNPQEALWVLTGKGWATTKFTLEEASGKLRGIVKERYYLPTIERLQAELAERETQIGDLDNAYAADLKELAGARAREGRKDKAINAALSLQHFVRKSLGAGPLTNLPGREGDLWRELNTALGALAAPAREPISQVRSGCAVRATLQEIGEPPDNKLLNTLKGLVHGLPDLLEKIGYADEEGLIAEAERVIAEAEGQPTPKSEARAARAPAQPSEPLAEGREHLTASGKFRSDKYPWCHDGFVPLKVTDGMAQDLLAEYARRRATVDAEFSRDLLEALPAPAPQECPHGCRGTGWIGAVNSWGDTAALPCPIHAAQQEPTPDEESGDVE